jgi:hypothetical protein
MTRVWPEHEGPIENVRNALAILVAYGDDPIPPDAVVEVKERLWRAVKLWESEQEQYMEGVAKQWERDHPDDVA